MSLTLSISGLSLTLDKFLDPKFPRSYVEPAASLEYSIYGSPIGDGPLFEPRHIWVIHAVLTPEEILLLKAIFWEFDRLRRLLSTTEILLTDTEEEFVERSPRTRTLAPSASVTSLGNNYISYHTQFKVWITSPPTFDLMGRYVAANLTLMETEKVVAA